MKTLQRYYNGEFRDPSTRRETDDDFYYQLAKAHTSLKEEFGTTELPVEIEMELWDKITCTQDSISNYCYEYAKWAELLLQAYNAGRADQK